MTKLTERQTNLYLFLKENGCTSAMQIVENLNYPYDHDAAKRNLSRVSKSLYLDIEQINRQKSETIVWKIIDNEMYIWLASTIEEIKEWVERVYRKPALNKLTKYSRALKKLRQQGQGQLFDENGDPYYTEDDDIVLGFISALVKDAMKEGEDDE